MKPDGSPDGKDSTTTVVEVRDGIAYNVTYKAVLSDIDGFGDWVWDDGDGGMAVGTLGNDGNLNLGGGSGGSVGMSENRGDFGGILTVLPIAAVAAPRVTIQRTAQITFIVAFDSSIQNPANAFAAVQAGAAAMQAVFDATPALRGIQIKVVNGRIISDVPQGGYIARRNRDGSITDTITSSIDTIVDHLGPTPGTIPILLTNNQLTTPSDTGGVTHPAGRTVRSGQPTTGIILTNGGVLTDAMLLAHEAGHAVGYRRPGAGPGTRDPGHSLTPGNLMTSDPWTGGRDVDAIYIARMLGFAIPIPRG